MNITSGASENGALIKANGLDVCALDANRSGWLTPQQVRRLRGRNRTRGCALLVIGFICISVAVSNLLTHQQSPEGGSFGAVTLLVAGVALLVLRVSDFGRPYSAELAAGRVSQVDGFVRIHHSSGGGESGIHHSYYYKIHDHEFETTEDGAGLIDPRSRYRIYYLPNSHIMVNIEPIGQACDAGLKADDIAAIVGEPMRASEENSGVGSATWPGMQVRTFESKTSQLRVVIGFLFGARDNRIVSFYRRMLARGPGSQAVVGFGDEATLSRGQLLVRRGDLFIFVILWDPDCSHDPERRLELERHVASMVLRWLG